MQKNKENKHTLSLRAKRSNLIWLYKIASSLTLLTMTLIVPVSCHSKETWQLLYQPRQRVVKTMGIYKDQFFIGTGNGVLVSKDRGKTWGDFGTDQLPKDTSGLSFVNLVYVDEVNNKIYIATNFGAYYSGLDKPEWYKIFESTKTGSKNITSLSEDNDLSDEEIDSSDLEKEDNYLTSGQVNSITVGDDQFYLSTNDGFWICNKISENACRRLNEGLEPNNISGNYEAFFSLKTSSELLLATSNGIYLFNHENSSWQRISEGIQKLPDGNINARYLYLDNEKNLWTACGSGVYKSSDRGKSWINKSNGIGKNADGFQGVFYLFESDRILYTATESGIYSFNGEKDLWEALTGGIRTKESTKNIYWLAGFEDSLYAATDEGLFVLQRTQQKAEMTNREEQNDTLVLKGKIQAGLTNLNELEPSVIEVQKQALRFSSLPTTNDYKRYRLQARLRNLVPRVGVDLNTTGTSTNYFQSDKGISTDVSLNNDFNAGRILKYQHDGKAFKQLSVLWNTDRFIYDDEIRYILNQARLTANIKENLLDDVTRIYFQRRRLQLETLHSPPKDEIGKLSNDLQIAELTGQLDSRTGGWFTKEIERMKK